MAEPDSSDSLIDQTLRRATLADYGFDASLGCNADGTPLVGNVPAMPAAEPAPGVGSPAKALATQVMSRLRREKRWFGYAEAVRDDMMRTAKATIPDKEERQKWVYSEIDRMYPAPAPNPPSVNEPNIIFGIPDVTPYVPTKPYTVLGSQGEDTGAIQGLSLLPDSWPTLPANASLQVELGWVQANRLRVVRERPGQATRVDLELALSAAPSWSALGWLETSIRSYAKFVDVVAKASGGDDEGESAVMRRERKSVDELRALLQEMQEAEGTCSRCGRAY